MLGAIVGDVIGSVHEGAGTKTAEWATFYSRCGRVRREAGALLREFFAARRDEGGSVD